MYVVKDHELYYDFEVNFNERKCSCRMFQQNQYPCIHAIAVLHSRQEYYKVLSYVGDGYLTYNIYSNIHNLPEDYQTLITNVINNPLKLSDQEEASIAGIYIEIPEAIPLTNRIPSIGENVTFDDPPSINNNSNSEEKRRKKQHKERMKLVKLFLIEFNLQGNASQQTIGNNNIMNDLLLYSIALLCFVFLLYYCFAILCSTLYPYCIPYIPCMIDYTIIYCESY